VSSGLSSPTTRRDRRSRPSPRSSGATSRSSTRSRARCPSTSSTPLEALDLSQRKYNALVATNPEFGWQSDVPQHIVVEESLAWDYPNLLTWLRAVEDRLDRPSIPGSAVRLGLIPASGDDELSADLKRASAAFKDRVGGERHLANFGLHAAKVTGPSTSMARIEADETLVVSIPDPPNERVHIFDQFTSELDRDLRTFAVEALDATEELVAAVIGAFERAQERAVEAREKAATENSAATESDGSPPDRRPSS
jgi:hypothetical protein